MPQSEPQPVPSSEAASLPGSERYRPRHHFSARSMWLNDPNGLIHHDGLWHLFFQANPEGDVWGNMSWGHATSPDLVTWTEHPVALRFTDDEHVFSGSVVCDHDGRSPFGRGSLVACYTSDYQQGSPRHGTQAQSLAWSTDGGTTWRRYPGNPVLDRGSSDFRDPKVFAHDGGWVMVAVEAAQRCVVLYRSEDLVTWRHLSTWTAADAPVEEPQGAPATVWECPDLFPLDLDGQTWWVLLVSVNPGGPGGGSGGLAYVGRFDGERFVEQDRPPATGVADQPWLDRGRDHYAAVSFADAPGDRRVVVGWMSNWDYARELPTTGWRSVMAVPRELSLGRRDGRVVVLQRPVPELAQALGEPHDEADLVADAPRVLPVPAGAGLLRLVLVPGPQGAHLDLDGARIGWHDGVLTVDRHGSGDVAFHPAFAGVSEAPVPLVDGGVELTIVRDACSIEVFADEGAVAVTSLVFPHDGERRVLLVPGDADGSRPSASGRAAVRGLRWW